MGFLDQHAPCRRAARRQLRLHVGIRRETDVERVGSCGPFRDVFKVAVFLQRAEIVNAKFAAQITPMLSPEACARPAVDCHELGGRNRSPQGGDMHTAHEA